MWMSLVGFSVGVMVGSFQHERVRPLFDKFFGTFHQHWSDKVLVHKK
eukprot:CAMPEP_0179065200 /NCGR_PEP_ID=MMETSP0796-20121207/28335_1 /TAXON_ID=73915 /ORGANISM="Pyrodinium bahamense, Strain pbaha01" /LENGTH=46 /DNA_ID= /DNA_START= /DNA_END= /DNA_ORIENTATION=